MITKAIVIDRNINSNKYNVRIPYLETAGGKTTSYEAILSTVPGISDAYAPGDVVLIGFEDHQPDKPIILGKLYVEGEERRGQLDVGSIKVSGTAELSKNTVIEGINVYDTLSGLSRHANNKLDDQELSTASVDDVQVNGTSVVEDGVANIVTNTAYDEDSNKIATMSDVSEMSVTILDLR